MSLHHQRKDMFCRSQHVPTAKDELKQNLSADKTARNIIILVCALVAFGILAAVAAKLAVLRKLF